VIHSLKFSNYCQLLTAAGMLVSCDTPQKHSLRELSKAGIEPSASALLQAVADQDSQRVGWLLDVGVYTEQKNANGKTPIRIAVEQGDLPSLVKLLDANGNVNAISPDHVSILGVAVERGDSVVIDKLLSAGAQTDGLMPDGDKILPWAIRNGRLAFVRSMMEAGADPHLKDSAGNPLLHVAMESGHRDLVDSLIDLGADPGAINAAGETTIQIAFRHGWFDTVPKLAAAGADPNAAGVDGRTLLDQAVIDNNLQKISLLLKIGADPNGSHYDKKQPNPLEQAFASSNLPLFQVFLDHGAKPPEGNWDGWLWKAFDCRNLELAHLLLNHGAKATTRGTPRLLLTDAAALAHSGSFVKLLMDFGNPVENALNYACANGDFEMVSLLLSCGANVNTTRIPSRDTPLSVALHAKQDRVAALLVQNGAEANLRLPEGQAPLHFAIATDCSLTVRALLAAGADPNAPFFLPVSPAFLKYVRPGIMHTIVKEDRNFTPLMLAVDSGSIATTRSLLKAGAKKNAWTRSYCMWPINFASRRGDVKMMRLLLGQDPVREERYIEIRLSEQRARMYDAKGNEIFTTKVSTGRAGFSTPTGEFVITDKNRDWTSTLYHASMPYFQRLSCGDFGLHEGNLPGYPASHGCIRLPAGNAAKLFSLTETGDRVKILP
jgi:ankyrin repeat protein